MTDSLNNILYDISIWSSSFDFLFHKSIIYWVLWGYKVQMNMYFFYFERKSTFKVHFLPISNFWLCTDDVHLLVGRSVGRSVCQSVCVATFYHLPQYQQSQMWYKILSLYTFKTFSYAVVLVTLIFDLGCHTIVYRFFISYNTIIQKATCLVWTVSSFHQFGNPLHTVDKEPSPNHHQELELV